MENLVNPARITAGFWAGRRVFVTGHTGFWGGWLCATLAKLGAEVHGIGLAPATKPSLFDALALSKRMHSRIGNILDTELLRATIDEARPATVLHLAAQALVRQAYSEPVDTFATNVMGTVHVLDAVRRADSVRGVVAVTTDKVYENRDSPQPYRENDRLGGREPYGASKACAEHVVEAYRQSYFCGSGPAVSIATVRAGNLIGGGDWAADRIVPDAIRAFAANTPLVVRRPDAVRPWQHVLEAVRALLVLAQALEHSSGAATGGWNFGPAAGEAQSVGAVAAKLAALWGGEATWKVARDDAIYEARLLSLDSTRAHAALGWQPVMDLDRAVEFTVNWYKRYYDRMDMRAVTNDQIDWMLNAG